MGDLCSPCHSYLVHNDGTHSQAYRNELVKANLRELSGWVTGSSSEARDRLLVQLKGLKR